jgi:hypothetical protein
VKTFTDNQNRPWTLRIDVGAIKAVRSRLGIDLADLSGKVEEQLDADPALLVDVLWVLIEQDAKGRNVSDVDFGQSMVGDPIDAATAALLEAKVDFFPSRRREILKRIAEKTAHVRKKADALAMAQLEDQGLEDQIVDAMKTRLTAELEDALNRLRSATSSPGGPESSIPTP